jgi:hypothetical protein
MVSMLGEVPPDHSEMILPSMDVIGREHEAFKSDVPGANFTTQGVSQCWDGV